MTTIDHTQPPEQPPAPDPELQRLAPLLGTWGFVGQSVDSLAGPAGKVEGTEAYEWLKGGYFLESRYKIDWGYGGAPNYGVMYWGYDSAAKKFQTHFFNDQGPYNERVNREGFSDEQSLRAWPTLLLLEKMSSR